MIHQNNFGVCRRCGCIEEVTPGAILKMCWRCAMAAADGVEARFKKESAGYDWKQIITSIKRTYNLKTEKMVGLHLGLTASHLTDIKKGIKPMPGKALTILKEKYAGFIKMKN